MKVKETESRKYGVEVRIGEREDEKRIWLQLDVQNVKKDEAEKIIYEVEAVKQKIEKILAG